ncbi:hypothetical protein, partial [Aeromonas caviae]|uniref:hypothetical protein n=1 Tax=Aeromonas caviae TaxID=648 RepID=UPI001F38B6E5
QDSEGRMFHGVSALLIEILAGINQQDTPLLLSLRTPEITITPVLRTGFCPPAVLADESLLES